MLLTNLAGYGDVVSK